MAELLPGAPHSLDAAVGLPHELAEIFALPQRGYGTLLALLLDRPGIVHPFSSIAAALQCRRGHVRRGINVLRDMLARAGFADAISCVRGTGYFVDPAMATQLVTYIHGYKRAFILRCKVGQ